MNAPNPDFLPTGDAMRWHGDGARPEFSSETGSAATHSGKQAGTWHGSTNRDTAEMPPRPAGVVEGNSTQPRIRQDGPDRRRHHTTVSNRDRKHSAIPANWYRMVLILSITFAVTMVMMGTIAPTSVMAAGTLAIALTLSSLPFARWERAKPRQPQLVRVMMAFCVICPLALTGLAYGIWTYNGGLDPRLAVAALISLNALSATLLNGRTVQLFSGITATWTPVALVDGSFYALGAMAAAAVAMAVVARVQSRLESEQRSRLQHRERARNRYEDILRDYEDTGQGWFWETDRRGLISYVSPHVAAVLDEPMQALLGRPFLQLFALCENGRENGTDIGSKKGSASADEAERTLAFQVSARSSFQDLAVRAAATGDECWWSVSGRPVYDEFNNYVGFRGSGTDLTAKRRSEENASRLALYDSLTGLANRFQMAQTLEKVLDAPQEIQRECSIFLIDLDRFKHVNDTLGHPAGDALLRQVADRVEMSVGEIGRVGRLGGDEFEVILPGRVSRNALVDLSQEIIRSLSQPYLIDGHRVVIGASVGIAISPEHGLTAEELVRNADLALYAAKDNGRGRYHFFSDDLHSAAEERSELERDLRDAIAKGSLQLYYQPVVQTSTERITGFEALLRWNHPTKGWLSPSKFVPIAEDTGLINAIGEWAIRTACHDLAGWPEDVCCAVNVSPLQFSNPQLPNVVTNAIAQAGIVARRLELEITESVFLNDDQGTDAMFAALKRVGVRLALDDFGTGYSSLGYLKKAPFDKIKIDQSFVRGATQPGSRNGAIIASITSLAQALGMDTTAEGVETMDELDLVRMHGCSHVQGYIYERPLSNVDATNRLKTGLAAVASGPRSARTLRQTLLRKVVLEHGGQFYNASMRNIAERGVMIEGLWNVPDGTVFHIMLSENTTITATSKWSHEDRMGVEFTHPLARGEDGDFLALKAPSADPERKSLRMRA
ncbi:putative bifunctional diguanylate cyclase/phosphodiesterase [Allopontixanthobacter confluentis]|nr:EAL domain-containing protein [Allopontixanthobacter confluentis]